MQPCLTRHRLPTSQRQESVCSICRIYNNFTSGLAICERNEFHGGQRDEIGETWPEERRDCGKLAVPSVLLMRSGGEVSLWFPMKAQIVHSDGFQIFGSVLGVRRDERGQSDEQHPDFATAQHVLGFWVGFKPEYKIQEPSPLIARRCRSCQRCLSPRAPSTSGACTSVARPTGT